MLHQNKRCTRGGHTCRKQLGNLALHEAELADKDIQDPAQLQPVGVGSGSIPMARKHDFNHAVQQLDAGDLSGHRCIWVLKVPALGKNAEESIIVNTTFSMVYIITEVTVVNTSISVTKKCGQRAFVTDIIDVCHYTVIEKDAKWTQCKQV